MTIKRWLGKLVAPIGFEGLKTGLADLLASLHYRWPFFSETLVLGVKITGYEKGACAIRLFEEAGEQDKIMVTHFSTEEMSTSYLEAQEVALGRGVYVTRIIPEGHDAPLVPSCYFNWLTQYPDNYKIIAYEGTPPPLDFAVLNDDEKVLLVLPEEPEEGHEAVDKFTIALTLTDYRLVRAFNTMFKLLLPSKDPEEGPDPTTLANHGSGTKSPKSRKAA